MKFVTKWISFIALAAVILVAGGCNGDDNEKSTEELQLDKLRGTWTLVSAVNDGVDRTDEYPGMTVTISGTYASGGVYNYTSTATNWPSVSPWNATDTWKFKADAVSAIIVRQSDLQDMGYTLSNSDSRLAIEFVYSGSGFNNGGRTSAVGGEWEFTFSK